MKKFFICSLAIFITWTVVDFLVHGIYLKEYYQQTAHLWRPYGEAKMFLNSVVVLIGATIFVLIYITLIQIKSLVRGLAYGFLMGVSAGLFMGYGFYAFSPIPYHMAMTWFQVCVAEGLIAGLILGVFART